MPKLSILHDQEIFLGRKEGSVASLSHRPQEKPSSSLGLKRHDLHPANHIPCFLASQLLCSTTSWTFFSPMFMKPLYPSGFYGLHSTLFSCPKWNCHFLREDLAPPTLNQFNVLLSHIAPCSFSLYSFLDLLYTALPYQTESSTWAGTMTFLFILHPQFLPECLASNSTQ